MSIAVFCENAAVAEMIRVLAADCPAHIAAADGDDGECRESGIRYAREHGVPLLLFSRTPQRQTPPTDVACRILGRPFLFRDFTSALRALTEDSPPEGAAEAPSLRWDPHRRTVSHGDITVTLTKREADVFALLYAAAPEPVSRETLREDFQRQSGNGADVYISYLRKKLSPLPVTIQSLRGQGYALLLHTPPEMRA